jgi:hypothetical protein
LKGSVLLRKSEGRDTLDVKSCGVKSECRNTDHTNLLNVDWNIEIGYVKVIVRVASR